MGRTRQGTGWGLHRLRPQTRTEHRNVSRSMHSSKSVGNIGISCVRSLWKRYAGYGIEELAVKQSALIDDKHRFMDEKHN
jgi:hypothetical protein